MHRKQNISHLKKQKSKSNRREHQIAAELNATFARKLRKAALIK